MLSDAGLLDTAINTLPFKLHISGSILRIRHPSREARSIGARRSNRQPGVPRAQHCLLAKKGTRADCHAADRVLTEKTRERITADSFDERAATTIVWAAMKAKTKLGMGLRKKKRKTT
ncbi:hypothetical protein P5V15_005885 [Pogonomyrmex californicus]